MKSYFTELNKSLTNVPPENIIIYDETNLTDDPGRKKILYSSMKFATLNYEFFQILHQLDVSRDGSRRSLTKSTLFIKLKTYGILGQREGLEWQDITDQNMAGLTRSLLRTGSGRWSCRIVIVSRGGKYC